MHVYAHMNEQIVRIVGEGYIWSNDQVSCGLFYDIFSADAFSNLFI